MAEDKPYEFGIAFVRETGPITAHRTGMTEAEAVRWIDEWIEDGGRHDVFTMIKRPVGDWERTYGKEHIDVR